MNKRLVFCLVSVVALCSCNKGAKPSESIESVDSVESSLLSESSIESETELVSESSIETESFKESEFSTETESITEIESVKESETMVESETISEEESETEIESECESVMITESEESIESDMNDEYKQYGDEMNDFIPEAGEVKLLFKHSLDETCGDDGEDYFYNYCPSIKVENNEMHAYYCTNKIWGNVTDYIGYRSGKIINSKLMFTDEQLVLEPTANTWDQRHTCDPSVIKGNFQYNGDTYHYLMAFLGCISSDCTLNETGIAVSKTYDGPWIKCNDKTIDDRDINPIVPCEDFDCASNSWGTGQPSLLSVDGEGKVLLLTTVGCKSGSFMDVREYDFSNINDYKLLRQSKVFNDGIVGNNKRVNNADYCFDAENKVFLMAKGRSPFGSDGQTPNFIADTADLYYVDASMYENPFDIFFDNERVEQWHLIGYVNQETSNYPRNHNVGLVTDEYGRLLRNDRICLAFTTSNYGSSAAMTYLKTYRIYVTTFILPYIQH